MREYILTEKEREVIRKYLNDKIPNNYFHVLHHRAKKSLATLKSDIELLEKLTS